MATHGGIDLDIALLNSSGGEDGVLLELRAREQIDLEAALNDFAYVSLDTTGGFGDCEGQEIIPLEVVPITIDNT